jgi:hypothetical protein
MKVFKVVEKFEIIFLLSFFAFFSILGFFYTKIAPPRGDEIHYLINAISIVKDRDINLKNNYDNHDYQKYFDGTLNRHTVSPRPNEEYLYLGVTLHPFLLAIPFIFFDRLGSTLLVCFASSATFLLLFRLTTKITKNKTASLVVCILMAICFPFIQFSYLLFPEIFGALLIVFSIKRVFEKRFNSILFLAIGFMPWIHLRFFGIALCLIILIMILKIKNKFSFSNRYFLIPLVAFLTYLFLNRIVFGSFDPSYSLTLANFPKFTGNILVNLVNIFFDRVFGLFIHSPIYALVIPGFYFWFKKNKSQAVFTIILIVIYLLPILNYRDWNGGYAPPARYLTAILPLFAPAMAFAIINVRNIIRFLFLTFSTVWGLTAFITSLITHHRGFMFFDGYSPFVEYLAKTTGINFTLYFPSFYPSLVIGKWQIILLILFAYFSFFWIFVSKMRIRNLFLITTLIVIGLIIIEGLW